jgi:hypothetical protein
MPPPLDRRRFLRIVLIGGAGTGPLALAAFTSSQDTTTRAPTRTPEQEPSSMTSTSATGTLPAYFSRPGQNYWYGDRRDLKIDNTEVLARMIAARTGCDVYRVDAADPYPDSYDDTVARNVREQDDDARPAIGNPLPDVGRYATVILASPIWNVRPPMIMSTLLEAIPLGGKVLLPVTTHAMSGLGQAPGIRAVRPRGRHSPRLVAATRPHEPSPHSRMHGGPHAAQPRIVATPNAQGRAATGDQRLPPVTY